MTHNDTQVGQLVLNLIEDKSIFNSLMQNGLNANELYLISNDNLDPVVNVKFENNKFSYSTEGGNSTDIVTIDNIKNSLSLATVATSGQYSSLSAKPSINGVELSGNKTTSDLGITINYTSDSLTNKPSINNVTLTGNKTTADLHIDYSDLDNLPNIPTVTSNYVQGNTTNALTAAGVDSALSNYVPKTRTVTGTGALGGGGQLNGNINITHNNGPVGLSTSAVKIGVDQYGHACLGASITATDVGAIPLKSVVGSTATLLDGSNTTIIIASSTSETMAFSAKPEYGKTLTIQYINTTSDAITLTIPSALLNVIFVNGTQISSNYALNIPANSCKRIDILVFQSGGNEYGIINIF